MYVLHINNTNLIDNEVKLKKCVLKSELTGIMENLTNKYGNLQNRYITNGNDIC